MKKYILLIALSILIAQQPLSLHAQSVQQSAAVSSSTLTDSTDGKSVIATFTFNLTNLPSSKILKIPEDGFEVVLRGTNYSEGVPATVLTRSGTMAKIGKMYYISPAAKNISFKISASFDKANMYNGSYTASLDGIYFATQTDPQNSQVITAQDYVQSQPNSTQSVTIADGKNLPISPYDNYLLSNLKLNEVKNSETGSSTVNVSLQVAIQASSTSILFYKSGIGISNASGKRVAATIQSISSNMIDNGEYYIISAGSTGIVRLQAIFSLSDLPHSSPLSLTVNLPDPNSAIVISVKKPSFWSNMTASVWRAVASLFSF